MVGKKKRGHPDLEEILARPWCYYCERDFDDLKILISHQKAKHFKCERCSRRLNTAGGLSVHMNQVHKETLVTVDNALGNRSSLDVEIFGMEGIPEDVKQAHNQRLITQFYQDESARRVASGNHGPGGGAGNAAKKPKFEAPGDLKARLAAHKARKAELAANGGNSGDATPMSGVAQSQSPAPAPGLSPSFANSPYAPPPVPYGAPPPVAGYGFTPEPYGQGPPPAFAHQYQQPPPFAAPGGPYAPPPMPYSAAPPPYTPQPSFSPGPYQQPAFPGAPPHYGAGTPPQFNPYQPPPHAPGSLPARPASLPQAPGLPNRPSFSGPPGGPPGGQFPMHQPPPQQGGWGQNGWNGPEHQNPAMSSAYPPHNQGYNDGHAANASNGAPHEEDEIDRMIRLAEAGIKPPSKENASPATAQAPGAQIPAPAPVPQKQATEEVTEKKSKKEKDLPKMVYSDNEVSPEEKMAKLPRYAFVPEKKDHTVVDQTALMDANHVPGVAGTVDS